MHVLYIEDASRAPLKLQFTYPSSENCYFSLKKESWILAAPADNRCSSLVCSCYVPSRNSDSKEDEKGRKEAYNVGGGRGGGRRSRERGFMESSKGVEIEAHPLKSNLKKSASMVEFRRVSWSDAHGKDIAHVQEFEPSEEGELAGVGKSCKCSIQ